MNLTGCRYDFISPKIYTFFYAVWYQSPSTYGSVHDCVLLSKVCLFLSIETAHSHPIPQCLGLTLSILLVKREKKVAFSFPSLTGSISADLMASGTMRYLYRLTVLCLQIKFHVVVTILIDKFNRSLVQ